VIRDGPPKEALARMRDVIDQYADHRMKHRRVG
jgi:hypothetical protein